MKIKVGIIYFGDIYDVNGINFVTNLFVLGKDSFSRNNLYFNKIFSLNGVIDVDKTPTIKIGKNVNKKSYLLMRYIRTTFSKIFNSENKRNAWFKITNSIINPARTVIEKNIEEINKENVLIFQDIFTAYFFLKKEKHANTILILHCESDPFEQLLKYYPSIVDTKYHEFLTQIKEYVYQKINKIVFLSKRALNNNISEKTTFIYNGIPDLINHKYSIDTNYLNLVCVGSMSGHKGQELIIDSLRYLRQNELNMIKLYFIGSGPQENRLKELAQKYKLEKFITFYGIRNDVDILLEQMNVLILPSKSEGMPLCIIEAMRQGMYILATNVGGISEMIKESFGKFITRDPQNIAIAIRNILEGNINSNYKMNSREFYLKNFRLETMIRRYSETIKEVYDENN